MTYKLRCPRINRFSARNPAWPGATSVELNFIVGEKGAVKYDDTNLQIAVKQRVEVNVVGLEVTKYYANNREPILSSLAVSIQYGRTPGMPTLLSPPS